MELKPRRQSSVPAGYKRTEVGVIPTDWEVVTAAAACELVVDCKNRTPPVVAGGEFAVVRTPNVRAGKFVREDLRFTDEPSFREWTARAVPKVGDILITREAPLGEVCLAPDDLKVCLGQRMMLYRPDTNRTESGFLLYALMSAAVQSNLLKKIGGSTVGHAKVDDIRFLELPLPPVREQRAIAEALSDVDALIGALDQIIAKKRDLKQAAMQQLLTGQKRLPGFHGEWEVAMLSNLLTMKATYGIVTAGDFKNTGVPMLRGGDIKGGRIGSDMPLVSAEKSAEYSRTILKRNDVVIALVGYPGEAARVREGLEGANISRAVGLLRVNDKITPDYLVSYLNSPIGRRMVLAPSSGSAQLVVNLAELNKLQFPLPRIPEQTAIAEVLSDMDAEIAALEQRRDKTRALKQGMMQELLTGRTRLPVAP